MSQLRQIIAEVKAMANRNSFRGNSRNPDEDIWQAISQLATAIEMLERHVTLEDEKASKATPE